MLAVLYPVLMIHPWVNHWLTFIACLVCDVIVQPVKDLLGCTLPPTVADWHYSGRIKWPGQDVTNTTVHAAKSEGQRDQSGRLPVKATNSAAKKFRERNDFIC